MTSLLVYYYPHLMVAIFIACMAAWRFPHKQSFILRAVGAGVVAVLISHLNRFFDWWHSDPYLPSGHMTASLSVAVALGLVRPWTLAVTLPLLVFFGFALGACGYHTVTDVLGAVPLVALVYVFAFHGRAAGFGSGSV